MDVKGQALPDIYNVLYCFNKLILLYDFLFNLQSGGSYLDFFALAFLVV